MNFAARLLLLLVVFALSYAVYRAYVDYRHASDADIAKLERELTAAKEACVRGPPAGPSCAESARLATEIDKRKADRAGPAP